MNRPIKRIKGFICQHCQQWVPINQKMGTQYRNHCPNCLSSKHVDLGRSGDRDSSCNGLMAPLGLTFKQEGMDKYSGKPKQGEIMIIHQCRACQQVSINRTAADDEPQVILLTLEKSALLSKQTRSFLKESNIILLTGKDLPQINKQLFGIDPKD